MLATKSISRIKTLFRAVISIGLIIYILRHVDPAGLQRQLASFNVTFLAFAMGIFFLQYFISAVKWKIILTSEHVSIPFPFLLRNYFIGNFISLFLPSSFGGDIYRVYALRDYNSDVFQNTSSVLFDRLTGLFALVTIALFAYAFLFRSTVNHYLLLFYFGGLAGFWLIASERLIEADIMRQTRILRPLGRLLKSFNAYRNNHRTLAVVLLLAFVFQNNIVLMNKLYCMTLGIDISLINLYVIIPLVYLTEALPITINGLGLREGAFIVLFERLGHTRDEALALALIVITVRYTVSLTFGGGITLLSVLSAERRRCKQMPSKTNYAP